MLYNFEGEEKPYSLARCEVFEVVLNKTEGREIPYKKARCLLYVPIGCSSFYAII